MLLLFFILSLLTVSQFLVLSLSLNNDVMATSKRCVKLFSLIFSFKCLTKFNLIRIRQYFLQE